MNYGQRHFNLAGAVLLAVSSLTLAAKADPIEDFYKGKTVRLVIGYGPGGGFDLYARTIGRYLEKSIPGHPTLLPQNMPGAGTIVATNWIYNVGPQDGTVIGLVTGNIPLNEAMSVAGIQFKSARINWIGNPDAANRITIVMASTGVRTMDDLKTKSGEVICGGPGVETQSIQFPQIMNNLLGVRMKIIAGYPDGNAVSLAMERGEVNCRAGNSWAGIKSSMQEWVREKKINVITQWGPESNPEVVAYMGQKVPLAQELARDDVDRRALNLLTSSVGMGRPFMMGPDVSRERVAAMRKAFMEVMVNPAFLEDAKALNLDINPMLGDKLQAYATEIASSNAAVLQRANELTALRDVKDTGK